MLIFFILVCHLLGDYMETIKKDFKKAATIYKSNCDDYNFGHSCHKFAGYSFMGKGCEEDQEKSLVYFKKGCSLGQATSCLNAGLLCVSNNEKNKVERDYSAGLGFFRESCDKGNGLGCYYVSGMYISGIPDVVEKDLTVARKYAEKACELNEMYSCANLSRMYATGDGGEKNLELANKFKEKASDLQKQAKAQFQALQMQQGT